MHTQKGDRSAHIYFEELRTGAAQTRGAEVLSLVCVRLVEQTDRVVVQVDNQLHGPRWKDTLKGVWWRVIVPREPEELDDIGKRRLGKVQARSHQFTSVKQLISCTNRNLRDRDV